jgi:hypothetical protein
MPSLKEDRKVLFYTCGQCRGKIRYPKTGKKPDVCPECGYGHGTRPVNDIPHEVRLNLNDL